MPLLVTEVGKESIWFVWNPMRSLILQSRKTIFRGHCDEILNYDNAYFLCNSKFMVLILVSFS